MSRAQLTSTVEQSSGGAVAPFVAGKNKIINGDFGIWQRGTTFTNPANLSFLADRFYLDVGGASGGTTTWSQVAFDYAASPAADKLPISGYSSNYFARYNMSSVSTSQSYNNPFNYKIEDVRTFAGQTVTFSAWVKSDSSRSFAFQIFQNFGSGGSSNNYVGASSTLTATTSWQRFTFTIAIPSVTGKTIGSGSNLWIILGGLAVNTVQTIDTWGWQLEAGSVATPFTTASGTFQGELALCQRYYYRNVAGPSGSGTGAEARLGEAIAYSSTQGLIWVKLPVSMRAYPSTFDAYNVALQTPTLSGQIVSGLSVNTDWQNQNTGCLNYTGTSLTTSFPYFVSGSTSGGSYIGFGAEL
jgi:hypothetical protein